MKKIGTLAFVFAYLTLSNYCLAYTLVTGECHNPYRAVEERKSEPPSHPGCKGHEEANPHEASSPPDKSHHSSQNHESSGQCCITFSDDNPVLNAQRFEIAKPIFFSEDVPVLIELQAASPLRTYRIGLDHGPPGLPTLKATSSHLTPRAPPYL